MRTAQAEQARYNDLTTAAFGAQIGVSAAQVRALIAAGKIPEAFNVSATGTTWMIPTAAVERFRHENSAAELLKAG